MAVESFGQEIRSLAQSIDKVSPFGQETRVLEDQNKDGGSAAVDAAIVESNLSLASGDQQSSLTLVLKTAIEGINAALGPVLGADAIQATRDSGIDTSPEATAERIVSLSTSFLGAFQEANPDLDFETSLTQFTELISSGIDQGFTEARSILDSLQVLEGDVATDIDTTYQLVQEKLNAFVETATVNNQSAPPSPGDLLAAE